MSLGNPTSPAPDWDEIREQVLERDNYRCTCCGVPEDVAESLHVDHAVPRGRGGSDRFGNLRTQCKQCHMAKHDDGYARMLEFQSTGRMDKYVFDHFNHFWDEMLPAMGRQIGVTLNPKFKLNDTHNVWFVSLGNIRHADAALATFDENYTSLRVANDRS